MKANPQSPAASICGAESAALCKLVKVPASWDSVTFLPIRAYGIQVDNARGMPTSAKIQTPCVSVTANRLTTIANANRIWPPAQMMTSVVRDPISPPKVLLLDDVLAQCDVAAMITAVANMTIV